MLALAQVKGPDALEGCHDDVGAEVGNAHAVDGHGQVLGLQTLAVASGARLLHHQPLDVLLDPVRVGLAIPALQVVDHTLVAGVEAPGVATVGHVPHAHRLVFRQPIQDEALLLRGQLLPWHVEGNAKLPADGIEHLHEPVL